jgi:tRNA(Arg) A34 adenosine deaminase TadA
VGPLSTWLEFHAVMNLPKQKFFDLAARISRKSPSIPKLGCVIVKKNAVLSAGFNNKNKTHTRSNHPFKTLHSEIHALLGLDFKDTQGAVAYVYREIADGTPAMSRPCPSCMMALKIAGIKRVFYTTDGSWAVEDI